MRLLPGVVFFQWAETSVFINNKEVFHCAGIGQTPIDWPSHCPAEFKHGEGGVSSLTIPLSGGIKTWGRIEEGGGGGITDHHNVQLHSGIKSKRKGVVSTCSVTK